MVDGVELLAHLAHPDVFAWNGPSDAYAKVASKQAVETTITTGEAAAATA